MAGAADVPTNILAAYIVARYNDCEFVELAPFEATSGSIAAVLVEPAQGVAPGPRQPYSPA